MPSVADRRLATIPKYLSPDEVERVLGTCNRQTATGRRDYAILLLLARLGLRAGEVVSLQLDDVDWRAGELLVRGKGLLHDRMPLPVDVGEALTSYLRTDRPRMQNAARVRLHEGAAFWLCWTFDIDHDRSPRTRSSGFISGVKGRPRAETQSRHDDASFWREHE